MTDKTSSALERLRRHFAATFLVVCGVLLLLAYPLAVLPPLLRIGREVLNNLPFQLSLPIMVIAALLAIPVIVISRHRLSWLLLGAGGGFILMLAVNAIRFPMHLGANLELLGYVTVPAAAALAWREFEDRDPAWLIWPAFGLWLHQVLLSVIALTRKGSWLKAFGWSTHFGSSARIQLVGTTGNINWFSALLVGLLPWVFCAWLRLLKRFWPQSKRRHVILAGVATGLPTAFFLSLCRTRAVPIALAAVGAVFILVRLKKRAERIAFTVFLATLAVTVFFVILRFAPDHVIHAVRADVRLPLIGSTVRMIREHPLGVGAANFRKAFAPYRAASTYHERMSAAHTTVHPHNELLNIAALLGVPAAIAFAILLWPLISGDPGDMVQRCARFSAVGIGTMALFDMTLVQPPVNLLGFLCLGLCWPTRPLRLQESGAALHVRRSLAALTMLAALIAAFYFAQEDLRYDAEMRQGELNRHIADQLQKRSKRATAQEYMQKALDAFLQAGRIRPNKAKPAYEAGRVALAMPQQLDVAETQLRHAHALDPNFAHLNALLGKLVLRRIAGSTPEQAAARLNAAGRFFKRECELYPYSPRAWHDWYNFTLSGSQYDLLPLIYQHVSQLYVDRAAQRHPPPILRTKLIAWQAAVAGGDDDAAIELANDLTRDIHTEFLDPLLVELAGKMQWPGTILRGGYSKLDAAYWHQEYVHRQLVLEAGEGSLPTIPQLTDWFVERYKIDPEFKALQLPANFYGESSGSRLSVYIMYSALVQSTGGWTILQLNPEGVPVFAIVSRQLTLYKVDLATGTCERLPGDGSEPRVQWQPGRTVLYFPVESFFLRTQILGNLLLHRVPGPPILPTRPPSMQLVYVMKTLTGNPVPPVTGLKKFCLRAPVDVYHQAFRATRREAGRP